MRAFVLAVSVLAGCAATRPSVPVTTLDGGGVSAVRDQFNRAADRPRLLALLSPS